MVTCQAATSARTEPPAPFPCGLCRWGPGGGWPGTALAGLPSSGCCHCDLGLCTAYSSHLRRVSPPWGDPGLSPRLLANRGFLPEEGRVGPLTEDPGKSSGFHTARGVMVPQKCTLPRRLGLPGHSPPCLAWVGHPSTSVSVGWGADPSLHSILIGSITMQGT